MRFHRIIILKSNYEAETGLYDISKCHIVKAFEEIATRLMSEGADVPVHKRGIRGYLRSVFAKNM